MQREMKVDEEDDSIRVQNCIVAHRGTKQILFQNDFQKEASLVMKKNQTRGKIVTAATNGVRVFFSHFFCEKCSKNNNQNFKNCARAQSAPTHSRQHV